MNRENRSIDFRTEVRAGAAGAPRLIGYAALFNSVTNIGGYFTEEIAPGAFSATIRTDDIRALFNHNADHVLGRNVARTLSLAEDRRGLRFEIDLPATRTADDLVASIERGDISGCSFAFEARRQEWDETGDIPHRLLLELRLVDVSIVTFPAYPDTTVAVEDGGARSSVALIKRRLAADLARRRRVAA
jgi:HK97 family phage prohead protease